MRWPWLILLALACSSTEAPDVSVDASSDTGERSDAARDASSDANFDGGPSDCAYFPPTAVGDDSWERIDPAALGWNVEALDDAIQYVGDTNGTAFVILHCGRIVAERYWDGWDLHTTDVIASSAKSMTAVLVAMAVQDGAVELDRPVSEYIGTGWSSASSVQESAISVRHLLMMTSGLDEALSFESDAGTRWFYNTPAYQVLADVIDAAEGMNRRAFSDERLEAPLGMHDSSWRPNSMATSARDMARFGLFVSHRGEWDGATLLGSAYIDAMLDPQELNGAYGLLWWLNGGDAWILPGDGSDNGTGSLIPDAPDDLVAALGLGDKKIYIVPSRQLVVVRHGPATGVAQLALSSFDNVLWQRLGAAMP